MINKKELAMCIKVLRKCIDYPNEEGMKFVLTFLEDDLEARIKKGKLSKGKKISKEHKKALLDGLNKWREKKDN